MRRFTVWAAVAAAMAVGFFALRVARWEPLPVAGEPPADGLVRVAGVVHVHTTLSDGGGPPEEVIAAAREAGLAFVGITDHNTLAAKPLEGYHDGLLVLVGAELSSDAGHLLTLGLPDPLYRFSGDALADLEDARDLGGFSFAAHPLSRREDFLWTGWDLPGSWGLELLNGDNEWRTAGWLRLAGTVGLYGLNRRYALLGSLGSPAATLARWDAMLTERDVPGIVGADAHSRVPLGKRRSLRFPSYPSLFSIVRSHVLLARPLSGEATSDARAVVEALGQGRSYAGLDALASADGFFFQLESRGRRWAMGDTAPWAPGLVIRAGGRLPPAARITLLCDGRVETEATARIEQPVARPGVYRVEVRVPGWPVPWVLSNPIYVFDDAARAVRAARAAWPAPSPAPSAAAILDDFAGRTILHPEFDSSSEVEADLLAPHAGPGGRGAGRLRFRLGTPGPGRPFVWCALVNREPRDLTGRRGLVFSVRGDGVYRFWVQVRDENPASADEGTEWWYGSVRTSLEWRRVAVPFAYLRSINKKTDGRLDLDKVRQLVLMVDAASLKPGSKGTIWLAELGVY